MMVKINQRDASQFVFLGYLFCEGHLDQKSPTCLVPGTSFLGDNFFMKLDRGMVLG